MKLLLLAGTGDARRIAEGLADVDGLKVIASLAGATRQPMTLACPTRVGGFGGVSGLRTYLKDNKINAVLDATHPFAAQMSHSAASVCSDLNMPHLQMLRPDWQPQKDDRWTLIAHEQDAAHHIAPGSVVFLATGRQTLPAFANLKSCQVICRRIDPAKSPFPFPGGRYLLGRPPFSLADEMALFKELKIDWLVVKNSGANASYTKLEAARNLGIRVAMIQRPAQPDCARVTQVADAINWVRNRLGVA